jgi:hypothetical protein
MLRVYFQRHLVKPDGLFDPTQTLQTKSQVAVMHFVMLKLASCPKAAHCAVHPAKGN